MEKITNNLLTFMQESPSPYHAIDNLRKMFIADGFEELKESETWNLVKGKKYFTVRNESSFIAFDISEDLLNYHYQITVAHSDSPTYKLKEIPDLENDGYIKLNVEGYGGMIASTWMDRPLSLAGRVLVNDGNKIEARNLNIDKDILVIPNVAIHLNRDVNKGYAFNNQVDLLPLFSAGALKKEDFYQMLADNVNCEVDQILGHDLFLYSRIESRIWGYNDEFIGSSRIDNLECTYLSARAMANAKNNAGGINVFCTFDNEEVGSGTKQGAGSTFLFDVLKRINSCLGYDDQDYCSAIARSFMLSCDNAHAVHPNHPEKTDVVNHSFINKGVVIKYSANQKYTTDAVSAAIVNLMAKKAGVNMQVFVNRSDMTGGSTLGNISNAQVSLNSADIGLPQLAMHSSFETAGSKDAQMMLDLLTYFFEHQIKIDGAKAFEVVE